MAIRKHLDQQKNVWVIEPSGYLALFNLPQVKEENSIISRIELCLYALEDAQFLYQPRKAFELFQDLFGKQAQKYHVQSDRPQE